MTSFIIYDNTTGVVRGTYSLAHDDPDAMANNTPAGCTAMTVDPSSPVCTGQKGWSVIGGVLQLVPPTDIALLTAAQATQLAILTASYDAAKSANVAYLGAAFMADPDSQDIFAHALTAYTAVGATPSDFFVVDANYAKVPMTLDQLKGLITAISSQVWAAFQRWVTVRQTLAAATTVEAVQAVVWS